MTHQDSDDATTEHSQHDADPRTAREQKNPEPVRTETLRDSEEQTRNRLENPPKAEGDRDEADSDGSADTGRDS